MDEISQWFALRDLSRPNAKSSAYELLKDCGIRCFTPLVKKKMVCGGRREWKDMPYMRDLLFAYSTRSALDPLVEDVISLQYRYVRGGFKQPMVVREADMNRFIRVTDSTDSPEYYTPCDITPNMCGRRIRIIGGPLDGCEGKLVTVRGSKRRRIMVSLLNLLSVAVEVKPEYIQFIED